MAWIYLAEYEIIEYWALVPDAEYGHVIGMQKWKEI